MNRELIVYVCSLIALVTCKPKTRLLHTPDISKVTAIDTLHWRPLGPFGSPLPLAGKNELSPHGTGRFQCVSVHPDRPEEILIGHATSGIFKTEDAGKSWRQVMNTGFSCGVFKILRFKSDPKHLLAATGMDIGNSRQYGYGLIESFDNGDTWVRNSLKFDPEEYSLEQARDIAFTDLKKEKSLIAVTSHKIYVSNSGALTWQMTHESDYNLKHVLVNPYDPKFVFVFGNGVLASQDGGYTFNDITGKINATFGQKSNPYASYFLKFSSKYPNKLYIVSQNQNIHLVKADRYEVEEYDLVSSHFVRINQSRLAFDIQHEPGIKRETLWIGTTRLVKSADDGKTFQEVGSPYNGHPNHLHDDVNEIVATDKGRVWVCTDGGVDVSDDHGNHWQSVTDQSLNLNASLLFGFDRSDDNTIMAGTQDNGLIMYKHGVWSCLPLYGDGGRVVSVSDSNDFSAGFAQTNYLILNGGKTLRPMHAGDERTGHDFRIQYVKSSGTLFIANRHLYKKHRNQYYEIISSGLEADRKIKAFWVDSANEQEIWLAKDDPTWGKNPEKKLWHSMDGGNTWIDRSQALPILKWRSITDIAVNRRGEIAVTLEAFDKSGTEFNKVYISLDGGRTFNNCSNGLPNLPVNCVTSALGRWLCGTNDGVYLYKNRSWVPLGIGFPKSIVTEIKYFEKDKTLLVSTFGRGLWSIAFR